MKTQTGIALAATVVALTACVPSPPPPLPVAPVVLEGKPGDLRTLAGHWTGEFDNEFTGQGGTISFSLRPGSDTAYARIAPDDSAPVPGCVDPVSTATRSPSEEEFVLRLGGVAVSEGSVGGWLVPYRDPRAGCVVDTWFEGLLHGDRLEGSFFSRRIDGGFLGHGTWWVTRLP